MHAAIACIPVPHDRLTVSSVMPKASLKPTKLLDHRSTLMAWPISVFTYMMEQIKRNQCGFCSAEEQFETIVIMDHFVLLSFRSIKQFLFFMNRYKSWTMLSIVPMPHTLIIIFSAWQNHLVFTAICYLYCNHLFVYIAAYRCPDINCPDMSSHLSCRNPLGHNPPVLTQ